MGFIVLPFTIVSGSLNASFALNHFTAQRGPRRKLAYASQHDLLVSTSFDYTAVLLDAATMREVGQLVAHDAPVTSSSLSPDGK